MKTRHGVAAGILLAIAATATWLLIHHAGSLPEQIAILSNGTVFHLVDLEWAQNHPARGFPDRRQLYQMWNTKTLKRTVYARTHETLGFWVKVEGAASLNDVRLRDRQFKNLPADMALSGEYWFFALPGYSRTNSTLLFDFMEVTPSGEVPIATWQAPNPKLAAKKGVK